MWDKFRKQSELCEQYREALEDLRPDMDQATATVELRTSLGVEALEHVESCDVCEEATEVFWASRNLLAGKAENYVVDADARAPWFATRVMARIGERETEVRRAVTEWSGAVAKLASRLAGVSALVLIVGSTWLYMPNKPGNPPTTAEVQSAEEEATPQYLFDSGTAPSSADDELLSPAER
jgi:hypothetical protein